MTEQRVNKTSRLTDYERELIREYRMGCTLINLSGAGIRKRRNRLEIRTPSPDSHHTSRRRRIQENQSQNTLEERMLTPSPPPPPPRTSRYFPLEERSPSPLPISPEANRSQRFSLEERTPSPSPEPSPTLQRKRRFSLEERTPSPSSLVDEDDDTLSDDELQQDIDIRFLNERLILGKNIIIKEYMLTGSESAKILIDHMASFLKILDKVVRSIPALHPNDRIQLNLKPKSWTHHISTPIVKVKDFRSSMLLAAIQAAAQSGLNIELNDDIRLDIRYLKTASGIPSRGGRKKYKRISAKLSAKQRHCIIEIDNDDNLCLPRAIAVGVARHRYDTCDDIQEKNERYSEYIEIKRRPSRGHRLQERIAISYCKECRVTPHEACGTNEIEKFESGLQIVVKVIAAEQFNNVVYDTMQKRSNCTENEERPFVYLYRTYNAETLGFHYDAIANIEAFYGKSHFCNFCNVAYNKGHYCEDIQHWCHACNRRDCIYSSSADDNAEGVTKRCTTCNAAFRNRLCGETHAEKGSCELNYYCFICKQKIKRLTKKTNDGKNRLETNDEVVERHWCGRKCRVCSQYAEPLHKCYLQKSPFKPKGLKYLFLDFETSQAEGLHIPIYCYLKWSVVDEDGITVTWEECAIGLSDDITDEVGTFLFTEQFKGYTFIAHNMRGYDGCFLLRYLAQNGTKPQVILRSRKILALFVPTLQIRIIDSLNFLPMALSQFSKAFNIPTTKGYFPHFFSKPETFDYIGELPPESMYGTNMKPSQYKEFKKWYDVEKEKKVNFNFRAAIAFYCRQDVLLLQQGCWVFRNLILEQTNDECDAFQYLTLPGLCNAVYKKQFMPLNSIAAVPPNGYVDTQAFSSRSLEWLTYIEDVVPAIKHIGNNITGEVKIANMRVDGFDESTKTVYEFYGCYYHACPKCYPQRYTLHTLFKQTLHHVYTITKEREVRLRFLGYTIIAIWECDWNNRVKSELDIQTFLQNNQHRLKPLDPFAAFFGGRVETFNLLIANDGRRINYEDVNSLYPYINASKEYPIGHPEMIFNNFGCLESVSERYFGFVYCKVKTPRKLFIPVLPGKYGGDGKLIFTLCNTCASTIPRQTDYCKHSVEERALVGVWFTEELRLAKNKGYEILEVYSVYHFSERSDKLFADYIRAFYKIKILSSGVPDCENIEEYIDKVRQHDKIDLSNESFSDNPSLRSISKLMLNSLWGKFGTRRIHPEAKFCSTIEDLKNLFDDDLITVSNIIDVHDEMVLAITKKQKTEFLEMNNDANIFVAACTTAYARIELYKYMDKVKERIVYTDTDCAFYISESCKDLPTGEFLGQLKNELNLGDKIVCFVSGGPKNYAYVTLNGVCVIKVKGISLTFTNLKTFTFENIAKIVSRFASLEEDEIFVCLKSREVFNKKITEKRSEMLNEHLRNAASSSATVRDGVISIYNPCKIKIQNDWKISSVTEQKLYTCLYDKRMVMKNFTTLPFGYCE